MKAKRVKSLAISLLLICVLVLSAGCAKAGAEKVLERAKEIENFDFEMELVMELTVMGQSMGMTIGADGTIVNDPMQAHMKLSIDAFSNGESSNEETEMYFEDLGDSYKVYTKSGNGWSAQEVEKEDFDSSYGSVTGSMDYSGFLVGVKDVKIVGQEKINGVDALQIECVIPAETIIDQMLTDNAMLDSLAGTEGVDMQAVIAAMKDADAVTMNVWVDKDYYPIKYSMDMSDFMADFLDAVFAQMGSDAAAASSLVDIDAYTIEMTLSNINQTDKIEMPAQAA